MDKESFYGITLTDKDSLAEFEVAECDELATDQKLIIKQIMLGPDAKHGEFNVVQAETKVNGNELCKIPIAVLRVGETRVLRPNIEFPSASVTFQLIKGTGPVYIYGQHVVSEIPEEEWYNGDDEDNEDDFDDEVAAPQINGKDKKK